MHNRFKFLCRAAACFAASALVLPIAVKPASAASVGATASVTIQTAVAITKNADLAFGTVSTSTTAGTAVINAGTGATSSTGGVDQILNAARGEFAITGEPNVGVTVSFQSANINLTGPGDPIAVNLTLSNAGPTLDGSGNATVFVGGTLNVNANQVSGAYSGAFTVIANY